ncbi:SsrA-binding protein [Thiosulfatimonas sediminis]|uniref:SsrA-binding protein n=1 Tax=Thiosulfatimonas sediminis TaxID=2675054 RepID=A0A6F8PVU5_9GAMM|nr:SsrA-binding protein SmpB [Thiosulfatimonas sediminis]BBP46251.1 SsrA-binding protein [Thiosulfatimonas sediminis]
MAKGNKSKTPANIIVQNKKARFEYFIEQEFEAGLALEGWEIKSLRQHKIQLNESYILLKNNEAWLFGALITPLISTSTHLIADPLRLRKLLMHRREIDRLIGAVDQKGLTLIPLNLHWARGKVKLSLALAKGKKLHDKRATEKDREWNRDKQRVMKLTR